MVHGLHMLRLLVAAVLVFLGDALVVAAAGAETVTIDEVHRSWPRLKVYYVNVNTSVIRSACIRSQLAPLVAEAQNKGAHLSFERYPAATFSTCGDAASCMAERPECFPAGKVGYIHHGRDGKPEEKARMIRGVLGNWCSHLLLLAKLRQETTAYDYFLVIEDDVIFRDGFVDSLLGVLEAFPSNWHLITMDTFSNRHFPDHDTWTGNASKGFPLYALSETKNTYWGAHAWLLSSDSLRTFAHWFERTPGIPLDWLTKVPHPPHMGLWAYQPSTLMQRQHVSDEEVNRLPDACRTVNGSDIIGSGEHDHVVPAATSFFLKQSHPVNSRPRPLVPKGEAGSVMKFNEASFRPASAAAALEERRLGEQQSEKAAMEESAHSRHHGPIHNNMLRVVATKPSKVREVVLMGMANSGVRLLRDLVHRHIEAPHAVELCKATPGSEEYCGRIWYHTHPRRFAEAAELRKGCGEQCDKLEPLSEVVGLAVVRHPTRQIRKLQEQHPEFLVSANPAGVAAMTGNWWSGSHNGTCIDSDRNCSVPLVLRAMCPVKPVSANSEQPCWESLPESWNSHTAGFQRLQKEGVFHKMLVLRFEDIVQEPSRVARRISDAVGLSSDTFPDTISLAFRSIGEAAAVTLQHEANVARLNTLDYGAQLSCNEINAMCARLDRGLFFSMGYHACQRAWPAYDELIFRGSTYEMFPRLVLEMDDWPERHRCSYGTPAQFAEPVAPSTHSQLTVF